LLYLRNSEKPATKSKKDVLEFFKDACKSTYQPGFAYDTVEAVLSEGVNDVVLALEKIKALQTFRQNPNLNRFP